VVVQCFNYREVCSANASAHHSMFSKDKVAQTGKARQARHARLALNPVGRNPVEIHGCPNL